MEQENAILEEFNSLTTLSERLNFLQVHASTIFASPKSPVVAEIPQVREEKKLISLPESMVEKYKNSKKEPPKTINLATSEKIKTKKTSNNKTSSAKSKVITIPSFFLADVRKALNAGRIFIKQIENEYIAAKDEAHKLTDEEKSLANQKEADKLQKKYRLKVLAARKADFKAALKGQKLALSAIKKLKNLQLEFHGVQKVNHLLSFLISIPRKTLYEFKDFIQFNQGMMYINNLDKLAEKERIKSMKIADLLQEEENKAIRKQNIDDMIAALKEQDRRDLLAQKQELKDLKAEYDFHVENILRSR